MAFLQLAELPGIALGFLAVSIGVQYVTVLPDTAWIVLLLPVAYFCKYAVVRGAILGIGMILFQGNAWLSHAFPSEYENTPILLIGTIESLPTLQENGMACEVQARQLCHLSTQKSQCLPYQGKIKLYGFKHGALQTGMQVQLPVKIKAPHHLSNPGSLDTTRYLFLQRVHAQGRVLDKQYLQYKTFAPGKWDLRQQVSQHLTKITQGLEHKGLIRGLLLGVRDTIPAAHWQLLQNTGTAHLLAISGLHISLVAGLVYLLILGGLKRGVRSQTLPVPQIAALVALLAATLYAVLAGLSIPTQRAWILSALTLGSVFFPFQIRLSQKMALATLGVLLLDPFAALSAGFWLSFLGAAFLSVCTDPSALNGWKKHFKPQMIAFIGLLPISLFLFKKWILVSPLMNLIAIPVVSFYILPLCFLGLIMSYFYSPLGIWVLGLSNSALDGLLGFLEHGVNWIPPQMYQGTMPVWVLIVSSVGAVLLFKAKARQYQYLGIALFLSLGWSTTLAVPHGQVKLAFLDVGQGLAVVVHTQHHTLLYDAGPQMGKQEAGERVILPYLYAQGVKNLDLTVISHTDLDHRGGLPSVLKAFNHTKVITSDPDFFTTLPAVMCRAGQSWEWDGVKFSFSYPTQVLEGNKNNRCCVLKIQTGASVVLLTGDIERSAERALVGSGENLKSTVLLVPHHGSLSSSSPDFLEAVQPTLAVVSTGYQNPYKHPRKLVRERYQNLVDTQQAGAVLVQVGPSGILEQQHWRAQHQKFWHGVEGHRYVE